MKNFIFALLIGSTVSFSPKMEDELGLGVAKPEPYCEAGRYCPGCGGDGSPYYCPYDGDRTLRRCGGPSGPSRYDGTSCCATVLDCLDKGSVCGERACPTCACTGVEPSLYGCPLCPDDGLCWHRECPYGGGGGYCPDDPYYLTCDAGCYAPGPCNLYSGLG
eukprot:CAMPEP_0119302148 /NCGR_PEP_ID=MMETSP1333-20130426/3816_1 /TAXON_ID=418940 /ORGANISM="Scyphosphaera apsteinii, Strain RCC1455" /LENGTH=161 /DNA_ID=CAMNT_0007304427 /DNA_START=115 /DNA_END=600 /DNA_ORIENTATION=-